MAQSLHDVGFNSAADLLSTYVGQGPDFQPWLKDAIINRDRDLRLQYLAGLDVDLHTESQIFDHMTAFGPHFSPNVFSGSGPLLQYLALAIQSGATR